jgi:porphyrinogen peroxidase
VTVPGPAPQAVTAPLSRAAMFLVVTIRPGEAAAEAVRDLCGDFAGLVRAVGFRDVEGGLSGVLGIGSDAWDRLLGEPKPAGLHPFREFHSGDRHAPATPGDLLFHLRATRMDLCFELATRIMTALGDAVEPADEVQGFRYFDDRDLVGFVDGTENPDGADATAAVVVGDEDAEFAGGSYVLVQKYLHDIAGWNALGTERQEQIIGRTKLADIELGDDERPTSAHAALTTIEEDGEERQIVRDNMPFGAPSRGEYGTYFIGYSRTPDVVEQMLENMVVGRPPGNYDRLLDFSTAVTGGLFFVPSVDLLEAVPDLATAVAAPSTPAPPAPVPDPSDRPVPDGSLDIGSLFRRPSR